VNLPVDEFLKLRKTLPMADVRSEKEFAEGHIAGAVNIPILNNEERIAVGIDYKQKGQAEAIKTGFRLVGPRFPEIIRQAECLVEGNELLVHCWRGGMRSANFCEVIEKAKIKTHQLTGGYKSYRNEALSCFQKPFQLRVIGGCTGSGKSEILRALQQRGEQIIDLEALANHKGSVFGGLMMPAQPTTEQFQNDLFEALMTLDRSRRIWVEDESISVGKIVLPVALWGQMLTAPVFEIDVDKAVRIERLVREYGPADKEEFLEAMKRITKKLGGQHFIAAKEKLFQDDMAGTIDILLTYYDKAYRTGLANKEKRIRVRSVWDGKSAFDFAGDFLSAAD
jgi:tRNA 2-selenouridine synthase